MGLMTLIPLFMRSIQRAILIVFLLSFYESTVTSANVLPKIISPAATGVPTANTSASVPSHPKATAKKPVKKNTKPAVKKTAAKPPVKKTAATNPTVKKDTAPNNTAAKKPPVSPQTASRQDTARTSKANAVKQLPTADKAAHAKLDSLTIRAIKASHDSLAVSAPEIPEAKEVPGQKYTIQICTLTSPIDDPFFTGKYAIKLVRIGDLYRYIYSSYTSIKSARADLPKIRKIYPEAFIRELQDNGKLGKAIDMNINIDNLN